MTLSDTFIIFHLLFRLQEDLEAVESRYKVDAKPEPYKPLRPAPPLEDDPPPLTTTKNPVISESKPDKVRNHLLCEYF